MRKLLVVMMRMAGQDYGGRWKKSEDNVKGRGEGADCVGMFASPVCHTQAALSLPT